MGLDLKLLPVDGDHPPHLFYAHQVLSLHRNAIVGDVQEVAEQHGVDIPVPLSCFLAYQKSGEYGYGDTTEDPYGSRLQFVLAKHLKPLGKKLGILLDDTPVERPTAWDIVQEAPKPKSKRVAKVVKGEQDDGYQSPLNRAAFAYICALPDEFKIVIYWC